MFFELKGVGSISGQIFLVIEMHVPCVALTLIISIFMQKKWGRLRFWQKYVSC